MRACYVFFMVWCLCSSLAFSSLLESGQITDLVQYADKETWVICDVDNTLIESAMHMGSAQWRAYIRNQAKKAGYDTEQAEDVLDRFWFFVQPFVPVRTVDANTSDVTRNLCQSSIVTALTARDPSEVHHTLKQLSEAKVCLSDRFCECLQLSTQAPSLYQKGVIFSGDNPKGETLLAFFKDIGCRPKKILYIDDRWEQVREVESCLQQSGIECVGMRFSGADDRVKAFQPAIADLQWAHLPRILSDDEAQQMLNE